MHNLLPQACYVALHIGAGPRVAEAGVSPPIVIGTSNRFDLGEDLWIERLDEELAKHVQRACDPAQYNIHTQDHDRHLYAFVRRVSRKAKNKQEGLADLLGLAALSRLVHPTSIGGRYCAKVHHFGLTDSAIQAVQYTGVSPYVLLPKGHRDWLSVQDGEDLRRLADWLKPDKTMHARVNRAYWYHEYAMHSYYLDARWPLVITGLEALVNVREAKNKWQFVSRLGQIARELRVELTEEELGKAYKLRSKLSHGESFLFNLESALPKGEQRALYEKIELLLRTTVRRCLLDRQFGDSFSDAATVEKQWPLGPPKGAG